jgi:hypothetical protein
MARIFSVVAVALLLGSQAASAADDFVGKWVNADKDTRGLTRIEVSGKDGKWTIQAWGMGGGGEIDQGKVTLNLLGDSVGDKEMKYGFASWDHKFADTHLTLRLEKGDLVVEDYTVFKDNSRRSNYRSKSTFKRGK